VAPVRGLAPTFLAATRGVVRMRLGMP